MERIVQTRLYSSEFQTLVRILVPAVFHYSIYEVGTVVGPPQVDALLESENKLCEILNT